MSVTIETVIGREMCDDCHYPVTDSTAERFNRETLMWDSFGDYRLDGLTLCPDCYDFHRQKLQQAIR